MATHTPANNAKLPDGTYRSDGDYRLSGKTLCGKSTQAGSITLTVDRPSCGQCLRNLSTVTGMLRDGRSLLAEILAVADLAGRKIAVEVPNDPFAGIVDVPTNDGWDA